MKQGRINITKEQIADFCQKNHINKLSFFGSVLRDDFRPDSDVDVLVDFEPDYPVGLFEIVRIEEQLSSLIGERKVDLRTPEDLSKYFRYKVIAESEVQYERS